MKNLINNTKLYIFFAICFSFIGAQAQIVGLPTLLVDTLAPTGTTLEYHNALPISASNIVSNPSNVDSGKYYIVYNYGTCYSDPTEIRVLQPVCPLKTVNIANYIDTTNKPLGMEVTLHSALPVSDANRITYAIQPAGKYYVAYHDIVGGCYSNPLLYIVKNSECTNPDNNATIVNLPISGNVSTNDNVSPGTVYGNPAVNPSNPSGCSPTVASNGTYTFVCATPGKYEFSVPVCPLGQTINCPTEILTITVLDLINQNPPVANTDLSSTKQNTPVDINVKSNDFTTNPGGMLDKPTIISQPSNGTASVNPDGTIKYIPNPTFVGKDTVHYQVCDTTLHPAKCDNAIAIIDVLPTIAPNTTKSADDFATTKCTNPAVGNTLLNDNDPELNFQSTTPQTIVVPEKGTFTLDSNGHFTFTPVFGFVGSINFPYTTLDNGSPVANSQSTIYIVVDACDITNPDFNETWVNLPVNGDLNTNDKVIQGSVYGNPISSPSNPSACAPAISSNGSYLFSCNTPGKYVFEVPVCPPGQSSGCPLELLTITVLDVNSVINPPIANTDISSTKINTPVTVNILSNDKTTNPNGSLGVPTIVDQFNHGTGVINPDGTVTYTPNSGFIGIDTLSYQVCDTTINPVKCDVAYVVIDVFPTTAPNSTVAADDYNITKGTTPAIGNVKTNDNDPEGNTQKVTLQTITNSKGTLVLDSLGNYIFTPAFGTSGPVDFPYTICDNGTPQACATAILHILVEPADLTNPDFNITNVNVPVSGNLNTNDQVITGTIYGTPIPNGTNPSSCTPVMAANGTYSFVCSVAGEYNFLVPVCPPGQTINCPLELLTITVLNPNVTTNAPTGNPDYGTTIEGTAITIDVKSNDKCNNSSTCTLSTPSIVDNPTNGTVSVDPTTGKVTYTPNTGFVGNDTLQYVVCDNQLPTAKCDTEYVFIDVLPLNSPNTTSAIDDYNKGGMGAPITGNVKTNDTDPEKNTQTVTPQNITIPGKGTFVLLSDGSYTFTSVDTFKGPIDIPYTICDNGTPQACATATLHILVQQPDITPNVTVTPNIMHSTTSFNATVKVTELNLSKTNGLITVRIPKDSRLSFTYNPSATMIGFTPVSNTVWTYNGSNSFYHIFTTTAVIPKGGFSTFGFIATFIPGNTDGKYTMTGTISSGSGSENRTSNNTDAESLDYFHN